VGPVQQGLKIFIPLPGVLSLPPTSPIFLELSPKSKRREALSARSPVRGGAAVKATLAELPHSRGGGARVSSVTSPPILCRPGVEATTAEGARTSAVRSSPMAA
jgi:hypothetical protein